MKIEQHLKYIFLAYTLIFATKTIYTTDKKQCTELTTSYLASYTKVLKQWTKQLQGKSMLPKELMQLILYYLTETWAKKEELSFYLKTYGTYGILSRQNELIFFNPYTDDAIGNAMINSGEPDPDTEDLYILNVDTQDIQGIDYPNWQQNKAYKVHVASETRELCMGFNDKVFVGTPSSIDNDNTWNNTSNLYLKGMLDRLFIHKSGNYIITLNYHNELIRFNKLKDRYQPTMCVQLSKSIFSDTMVLNDKYHMLYYIKYYRSQKNLDLIIKREVCYLKTSKNKGVFVQEKERERFHEMATAGDKLVVSVSSPSDHQHSIRVFDLTSSPKKGCLLFTIPTRHSDPTTALVLDKSASYLFSASDNQAYLFALGKHALCLKELSDQIHQHNNQVAFCSTDTAGILLYLGGYFFGITKTNS